MRVTGTGYTPYLEKIYADNKKSSEKAEERKTLTGKDGRDRLELSKESKDIKGYTNQEVNTERMEKLRSLISKGEYEVSSQELASAMMRRMAE